MPKIVSYSRQEFINQIMKQGRVSYVDLSKTYSLSLPVVRKICQDIATQYPFQCYRGYIMAENGNTESYFLNIEKNKIEKNSIAAKAAEFVEDGDTIFIGAGTTTYCMCNYLREKKITVITNSIPIINRLMVFHNITTIAVGGILQNEDMALVGDFFETFTKNLNAEKIFLGSEGFDVLKGATRSVIQKNMTEQSVVQLSGKKFLLVDHTKLGVVKTWQWLPVNKIDTVVTSTAAAPAYITALKHSNIELILVSPE